MEIQCALETRSLDSKRPKKEVDSETEDQNINLLQPKEHRRRRDENREEVQKQVKGNFQWIQN